MTYLGLWDAGQLSKVVAELHVLELEGVVPVVLKRSHDLVTHPLHLNPCNVRCASQHHSLTGEHMIQPHKRFKRMLLIRTKTQSAIFGGNPLYEATKHSSYTVKNDEKWDKKLNLLSVFGWAMFSCPVFEKKIGMTMIMTNITLGSTLSDTDARCESQHHSLTEEHTVRHRWTMRRLTSMNLLAFMVSLPQNKNKNQLMKWVTSGQTNTIINSTFKNNIRTKQSFAGDNWISMSHPPHMAC